MQLNVKEDVKVNRFKLEEEAEKTASLLNAYDDEWNEAVERVEKLNAQVDNLNDELKNLRLELIYRAKTEGDGKMSDKLAEAYAVCQSEYKEKFNQLREKREERASAVATEQLFKNYHFQLIERGKSIDILTRQWIAQYYSTDMSGGSGGREKNNNREESANVSQELTEKMQKRKLTRREK